MTPTTKLRFVQRIVPSQKYGPEIVETKVFLQQWWAVERAGQITPTGEWRDVPIEKENT
jgi:hypothetical protein